MGMINTGKCPKCDSIVTRVEVDAVDVTVNWQSAWKGVAYHCPSCHAVLGVGIDPVALKSDTVNEVVEQLFRRLRTR